jgi:DNA-binding NarL/FixJ family response regulator
MSRLGREEPKAASRWSEPAIGIDFWAPVGTDGMPQQLLDAFAARDWAAVKTLVTSAAPRGVFGRQASQLRSRLPLGVDPALTQLRGWDAFLQGDWDDLQRCLDAGPLDPVELELLRDAVLAPVDTPAPRRTGSMHHDLIAMTWDYDLAQRIGPYRHIVREMLTWRSRAIEERGDVDVRRHVRYRRLQDVACLAFTESLGGSLPVAIALAQEAQRLGDDGDVLRDATHDIAVLSRYAAGEDWSEQLVSLARLASPRGSPAVEACIWLLTICPLLEIRHDGLLAWAATLAESLARRIGSPRFELHSQIWRLASGLAGPDRDAAVRELPGLLMRVRDAAPGLAGPAYLVEGVATRRADAFEAAARLAARSGQVWALLSAQAWLLALRPDAGTARRFHRLLGLTGWRRLVLVPNDVAANAARAVAGAGTRSHTVLELAAASGRAGTVFEIARAHLADAALDVPTRVLAVELLARVGSDDARDAVKSAARETGAVGRAAAVYLEHRPPRLGLTERELEVVELAGRGLTNREIGEQLSLSPHTVARHLSNARDKLGAANRAEAAARIGELQD